MAVLFVGNTLELVPYAIELASVLPKQLDVLVFYADAFPSFELTNAETSARAVGFLRADACVQLNTGKLKLDRSHWEDMARTFHSFPRDNAHISYSAASPDPNSESWNRIVCAGGFKRVIQALDQAVIILPPSSYSGDHFLCQYLKIPSLTKNNLDSKKLGELKPNGYFLAQELARLFFYTEQKDIFSTCFEVAFADEFASNVCREAGKSDLVDVIRPTRVLASLLSKMTPLAVGGWNALALEAENQDALTYQSDICAALELRFRVSEVLCPSEVSLPVARDEAVRVAFASVSSQGAASAFERLLVRTAEKKPLEQIEALNQVVSRDKFQWSETRELARLSKTAADRLLSYI